MRLRSGMLLVVATGLLAAVACSTFDEANDAPSTNDAGSDAASIADAGNDAAIDDGAEADSDVERRRARSLAYAAAVLADNPIAYFRFPEKTGPTLESAVQPHALTVANNAPKLNVDGLFAGISSAVSFDGTNGQRLAGATIPMVAAQPFAFEAWVRLAQPVDATTRHLVMHSASSGTYGLILRDDGTRFYVVVGGTRYESVVAIPLSTNKWHHLVANAPSLSAPEVFVDNVRTPFTQQENASAVAARDFTLGAESDTLASIGPDAQIAEVAVYEHALPAERILAHFTRGTAE